MQNNMMYMKRKDENFQTKEKYYEPVYTKIEKCY
jgi:hypothetical protein